MRWSRGWPKSCIAFESAPRTDLRYEPLVREYQQLYCSRHHPLFGARARNPELLADEAFIVTGQDEPEDVRNVRLRYREPRRSQAHDRRGCRYRFPADGAGREQHE
jgi:hypothetical protein